MLPGATSQFWQKLCGLWSANQARSKTLLASEYTRLASRVPEQDIIHCPTYTSIVHHALHQAVCIDFLSRKSASARRHSDCGSVLPSHLEQAFNQVIDCLKISSRTAAAHTYTRIHIHTHYLTHHYHGIERYHNQGLSDSQWSHLNSTHRMIGPLPTGS